ncbi:hypothetical protein [Kangiella geojedonensis]|uniref:Uncharacterized protein n=1 Tax=Kangiella geojedonensis TaxID=914150 RepID=A0A0F6TPK6_9GAMM|nr:hypothetical protein [Kangiella geojedonensis]AKE51175.1 hypothetical protein TQ33_0183 [Kangiella geojedonensis]
MDSSEKIAFQYLSKQGFNPIYEPDGNITPDFLIKEATAVEVRRLNQNVQFNSKSEGLEELSIPLWHSIEDLAQSINYAGEQSWFLFYSFTRPIGSLKKLKHAIRKSLIEFASNEPTQNSLSVYSQHNFRLDAVKASSPLDSFFIMGGFTDRQAGGWLVSEMIQNIDFCSKIKRDKISVHKSKYKEWWLLLIDQTGFNLRRDDIAQLRVNIQKPQGWDKVMIINPMSLKPLLEL